MLSYSVSFIKNINLLSKKECLRFNITLKLEGSFKYV